MFGQNVTQEINIANTGRKMMPNKALRVKRNENRVKRLIVIILACAVLINLVPFGKGGKPNRCLTIAFVLEHKASTKNNYKIQSFHHRGNCYTIAKREIQSHLKGGKNKSVPIR